MPTRRTTRLIAKTAVKASTTSNRKRHRAVTRKLKRRGNGCELSVHVVERQGALTDQAGAIIVAGESPPAGRRSVGPTEQTARVLASVGHPMRLKVLWLLLKGPAVYHAVQRATGLRAGPLYHHINQLRLAGLIRPKQRNFYELTRGGRNVVLMATALNKLAKDNRTRPIGVVK